VQKENANHDIDTVANRLIDRLVEKLFETTEGYEGSLGSLQEIAGLGPSFLRDLRNKGSRGLRLRSVLKLLLALYEGRQQELASFFGEVFKVEEKQQVEEKQAKRNQAEKNQTPQTARPASVQEVLQGRKSTPESKIWQERRNKR
jgi:hypothetical protein